MKIAFKQIALIIAIFIVVGLVQACAGSNLLEVTSKSTTPEVASPLPDFKVSSLTISPPEANTGVQVIVTARVTNNGNAQNSYTPEIRIDDITRGSLPSFRGLPEVAIPAESTQLLSFVIPAETPGAYKVTWGELTGEFKVVEMSAASSNNTNTVIKAAAPDFTGVDVATNQPITLSQFKGSIVLLNFVNYGCSPEVNNVVSKQLLVIKQLKEQRADFVPVSVFCGCCPPEVLRNFARQNNLTWPWILDSDNSIVRKYVGYLKKYGYPTLILIDQEQNVRMVSGYSDLSVLSNELDQVINGKD
ncbi:MAG: redoxin domain-containing protein [Chloroflexota bacterium]